MPFFRQISPTYDPRDPLMGVVKDRKLLKWVGRDPYDPRDPLVAVVQDRKLSKRVGKGSYLVHKVDH